MVCVGTTPDFTVVTNPEGAQYHDLVHIAYNPNVPGPQEVIATCGSSSVSTWVTVVKVDSIDGNPHCWEGETINLTALPYPSETGFPSGSPTWSASDGTFPSGNTGPSVTWQAPAQRGGWVSVKAECGASSVANVFAFVNVSAPAAGGDLLREETDSFSVTVEPAGYPVSLAEVSTPPELAFSISGLAVAYENLIEATDVKTYSDQVAAKIEAALDGMEGRILGFEYNLKKSFADWYENVAVFDGKFMYGVMIDSAAGDVGNRVERAATHDGFNSIISGQLGDLVRTMTKTRLEEADPFPGTVTDSVINERATFSWTASTTVEMGSGNITIKQSGYPGWPDVSPPSIPDWIAGVNEYGFTSTLFDLVGLNVGLSVSGQAANLNGAAGVVLSCEDPWGTWELTGGLIFWMGW